ncbi:MAG: hypothetical protein U5L96_14105 [Owenweeksia sp.]|nr:hypothetical protein [Owenweeksia sp.]
MIGAVHFYIWKEYRDPFDADAGYDQAIYYGDSVNLSATKVNEPAVYNWYDSKGNHIYSGTDTIISPSLTEKYKLEVISLIDGFKDYDEMEVTVNKREILDIVPNPAKNEVTIGYSLPGATSAYLMLVNVSNSTTNNYILSLSVNEILIDLNNYPSILYKVVLVSDGEITDEGSLIIEQ